VKKHRFDMPLGVENDAAKWKKIVTFVQTSFTERRAAWKKTVSERLAISGFGLTTDSQVLAAEKKH
jgi:hypothetical protein